MMEATHDKAQISQSLKAELGRLTKRQDKSRLVATELFFAHGVHPSAALVREITQHGSLTDIQRDLRAFWEDLRKRGQIDLQAAQLPQEAEALFQELAGQLWRNAQDIAVEQGRVAVEEAIEHASIQVKKLGAELEGERARSNALTSRLEALNELVTYERQARETVAKQLEQTRETAAASKERIALLETWLNEAAQQMAQTKEHLEGEIAKLQQQHQRNIEVLDGEIAFAKMQIEHARQALTDTKQHNTTLRSTIDDMRHERSLLQQRVAKLETSAQMHAQQLHQATGRLEYLEEVCEAKDARIAEMEGKLAESRAERPNLDTLLSNAIANLHQAATDAIENYVADHPRTLYGCTVAEVGYSSNEEGEMGFYVKLKADEVKDPIAVRSAIASEIEQGNIKGVFIDF